MIVHKQQQELVAELVLPLVRVLPRVNVADHNDREDNLKHHHECLTDEPLHVYADHCQMNSSKNVECRLQEHYATFSEI